MIGFVMAFPCVAVQMFLMDKISPVNTAITYGIISFPWCLKPIYGFVSDKYPVFDLGHRKPYIAWASLMLGFLYTFAYDFEELGGGLGVHISKPSPATALVRKRLCFFPDG